jgi:phage major head subunit gpT-like protein
MAVVTPTLSQAGIRAEYQQALAEISKQVWFEKLSTRLQARTKSETFGFLGTVPPMRPWGTGRLARGVFEESYSVETEKYECTLEVSRDSIEDDQTGAIRLRIRELAQRAGTHKDYLLGQLLINGGSAGFTSYDGSTFFATDHESGKSGAQSNKVTASGTATPTAPTTAEFRAAFSTAIAQLLGLKDDQGEPMSFGASGLVCVVPPSMLLAASEALNASFIASTDNILKGAADVVAYPWLTNGAKFYLVKSDVQVRPFVFLDRIPLEFRALEGESESGFVRDTWLYGVRGRYTMTYGYWQFAIEVEFTS